MMNTPALWYMCKFCMTPFYNLADLEAHKKWFHPQLNSLPEQGCPPQNPIDQFGKLQPPPPQPQALYTTDDKKFKQNSPGKHNNHPRTLDKVGVMKHEDRHLNGIEFGQCYPNPKPEINTKRDEPVFPTNDHHHHHPLNPLGVDFSGLGVNMPSKNDYQNYSALSFDLSMFKPKPDTIETLPISELDAFFSKDQINQLANNHRNLNLSPRSKTHGQVNHVSTDSTPQVKKEKKKRLSPPKNYSQTIPNPQYVAPQQSNFTKSTQKNKKKCTNSKETKAANQKSKKSTGNLSCCFCGEKFDNAEKLKVHELDEGLHFDVKIPSRSQPVQPVQAAMPLYGLPVPGDDNLYKCRYCPKQVAHRWSLIRHERKHTGEKRFRCQYCQKPIDDKCALAIHERTHTGERPYKCMHCDATFARRSSTKRHELAHIGIKPKSYPRRRR